MQPLSLEEFEKYAKNSRKVAVFEEIPAGDLTPVVIYQLLRQYYGQEGVLLESLHHNEEHRHAHVSFDPVRTLSIPYGSTVDPLDALREMEREFQIATRPDVADLVTRALGFITYDAASGFENIKPFNVSGNSLPLCLFHFYALNIAVDYDRKTVLVSLLTEIHDTSAIEKIYHQARDKIKNIIEYITQNKPASQHSERNKTADTVETDISDHDFMQMVEQAKKHIVQGDVFQIVLSRSFKRQYTATPFEMYLTLREVSPSPYMFYFPTDSQTIIGASPERLVRVRQGEVTVNPIAGTRRRHHDQTDEMIAEDLLSDKKELAEHMMLVDLARNDVGAVSTPGSVRVKELLKVKHYSHVSHMTSAITGQLQKNKDVLDALRATIPAGTLSGAPKVRAMQLIAKLEKSPRGVYGGAICRLDLADNFDSCIAIRMAVLKDGIATIRTGAGIVYDSDPAKEAEETRQKARSLLHAIAKTHEESFV